MDSHTQDLEATWDDILDYIEEGLVVPVVGEELLEVEIDGVRVRLYSYLAERLAERLGVKGLEPGATLNDVVSRYVGPKSVYKELKRAMPDERSIVLPEAYTQLARITDLRLFVTTTFDSLLERAINEERFKGADRTDTLAYSPQSPQDLRREWAPDDPAWSDGAVVYHLLGRLSALPEEYVVSEEDLLEFLHALQSETRRPTRLHDALCQSQVLFIGCAFSGWLARSFIRLTKGQRLSQGKNLDIVADSAASADADLILFLSHFSTRTTVLHQSPAEFVDELCRRWTERRMNSDGGGEAPSPDAGRHKGEIFLSYASEDRETAMALRDALESEGMDVWFDRDELQSGDNWKMEIERGLRRCSLFVPLISRHTLTPEPRFFRREWALADEVRQELPISRHFVVPVAIDDTPPDAPEIPAAFAEHHWFRLGAGAIPDELVGRVVALYRAYQESLEAAWA